jgi:hypothetical protein
MDECFWKLVKARTGGEEPQPQVVVLRAAVIAVGTFRVFQKVHGLGPHHDARVADWILHEELALKVSVALNGIMPPLVPLHAFREHAIFGFSEADRAAVEHINFRMFVEEGHLFLKAHGIAEIIAIKSSKEIKVLPLLCGEVKRLWKAEAPRQKAADALFLLRPSLGNIKARLVFIEARIDD